MKIGQKICSRFSALFFVASLLAGVCAVQEIAVSSASAQANPVFTFSEPTRWPSNGTIHTYAHFKTGDVTGNQITLTVELWYEKFNPQTGRYTPARACSQTLTNQNNFENAFSYDCAGVPSHSKVQVRAIATGYTYRGVAFSVSGSGKWKNV